MAPCHLSAAQHATHNREVQRAQDESLAAFLASRNQTAPPTLRRQHPDSGLDRDERCVRQRREDRNLGEDVHDSGGGVEPTQPDRPWANIPVMRAENQSSITPINTNPVQISPVVPQFDESPTPGLDAKIDDLQITAEFIEGLRTATLEKSNMRKEDIQRLREAPSELPDELTDRHFLKALRTFLATTNASQETYNGVRAASQACYPDDPFLSFDQIKRKVETITGVVPIIHDMCVDTCVGFTGPFDALDTCPKCSQPRYHPGTKNGRRQFSTIPIGPVIQALYQSGETAELMHYLEDITEKILQHAKENGGEIKEYNDTACGNESLHAWRTKKIKKGDISLQISLDGAQLYRDKESDCWIFIYIIHNLSPELRYKKRFVIPGGFIGGPFKPKYPDSHLYPSIYHISALQTEGLRIWDASTKSYITHSTPFLSLATADGPAMTNLSGMVGHSGKYGCRLYCGLSGRRRDGDGHYFPLLQKPNDYNVTGCNHPDVTFKQLNECRQNINHRYQSNLKDLMAAQNQSQYNSLRLSTGLCKPTLFSGLRHTLGIPNIFVMDLMHLTALNDPDLLLGLWRGTIKCYEPDDKDSWDWKVLTGKVWESHGKTVAMATSYLPSSFGRAPRNPAEKINSGYKAWEFLLYLFSLGPALFHSILPKQYWQNFCKFVRGIQLLYQTKLSPDHIKEGHRMLCEFHLEFEDLYIRRHSYRIHFLRQSIHLLTHIAPETIRAGPLSCYAQWTMETVIGNLGDEIRQDKDPYANIAQRGILRAQINSLVGMMPDVLLSDPDDKANQVPRGGKSLGDGFVLLRACQMTTVDVSEEEATAIMALWAEKAWPNQDGWPRAVQCWGRLRLPNGQLVRSRWVESRSLKNLRRTTVVKFRTEGYSKFAEIQYFFRLSFGEAVHTLAVVSVFSPPNRELLDQSFQTVYACHYMGDNALFAIDVKQIESAVSMIPYFKITPNGEIERPDTEYFLMEKLGLGISSLVGEEEEDEGLEDDDMYVS